MRSDFDENLQTRTGLSPFHQVVSNVESQSPIGKFAALTMEAQQPGSFTAMGSRGAMSQPSPQPSPIQAYAQPQQPQPMQAPQAPGMLAKMAGAFIPGLRGALDQQHQQDISKYVSQLPHDQAIQYMAGQDKAYMPALLEQNDPLHKIQLESAQLGLSDARDEHAGNSAIQNFAKQNDSYSPQDQAQLMQESGGNPNAVSPKGAAGKWQIMPETARDPGYGITPLQGWDGVDPRTAPQAEQDRFHRDYQAKMEELFAGRAGGLAAYNAGPGKMSAVVAGKASLPAETAAYVPKIMAKEQELSAIQRYQQMATHMAATDPKHYGASMLAAYAPSKADAPQTGGLPQGYMWEGDHAKKIEGLGVGSLDSIITPENAHLTGDEFINSLDNQDVQNKARAMLRGDMPPPAINSRTPSVMKQALEAAQQADPTFSAATFPVRKATKIAFSTGPEARNVNALNTLINHLGEMNKNDGKLPANSDYVLLNKAENAIGGATDDTTNAALNNYKIDMTGVGSEAAKAYKGVGAISVEEQKEWQANLSLNNGPETRKQARQEIARLVAGKINALEDQWKTAFPNEPKSFLTAKAQKHLKDMGIDVADFLPETEKTPSAPWDAKPATVVHFDSEGNIVK